MRRGCIAVGLIKCDICGKIIEHGDRYLILDDETEPKQRVCLNCCDSHNYGRYEIEKGERIFTLLVDEVGGGLEKKKAEKSAAEKDAAKEVKPEKEEKEKAEKKKAATGAVAEKEKPKKKGAKGN
jgi:hypothetical protein